MGESEFKYPWTIAQMHENVIVVFDVRSEPTVDLVMVLAFAFMLVAGRILTKREVRWFSLEREQSRLMGYGFLIFSSVPLLWIVVGYAETTSLRSALTRGDYVLVEGTVQDFFEQRTSVTWSVESGGKVYVYEYSEFEAQPGFHDSAGPVRSGQHVRITDVHGTIARLEIRS
jgi:hypothetical protein